MRIFISALVVLLALSHAECDTKARVVCYYTNWAVYRDGIGRYSVEDIPVSLCTHILYSFIGLTETGEVKILDPESDIETKGFANFTSLKVDYPEVKFIVVIGGWNEGGAKYSKMVSTRASRKTFIDSIIKFINDYGFDGLDLDWEYPGATDRDGKPEDKANFLALCQELRVPFDEQGWELTAAVPLTKPRLEDGYDVPGLCKVLDAVHVMGYDLRANSDGVADNHAPLNRRPSDLGALKHVNVRDGLQLWEDLGCPANKLVVGVPFYGRSFILASPSETGIGAPINVTAGGGDPLPYTEERGYWAYFEICSKLQNEEGWTKVWDNIGKAPYAYKDNQWVGYSDVRSLQIKMEFIKKKGYLGAMTWALDLDDFRGLCGDKLPLLSTLHTYMNTYTVPEPVCD
ncbi:endochitinase [Bicyclus anynana]|uniref:Endochitinase n=1 Tax=Bicyclus anynana TaxID=110368 RepID=A0ABM3LZ38_BICAN|nr:endochitinase [Bicyclus anynana]